MPRRAAALAWLAAARPLAARLCAFARRTGRARRGWPLFAPRGSWLTLPMFRALAATLGRVAFLRLPLGAGLDHRQRHAVPLLIHRQHPDVDHVADGRHLVGALHVAVGHLADVYQAAVLQADIDERAEVDHVQDRALQLHARLEVLELEDALLEHRRRQVVARVAARARQCVEDVAHRRHADMKSCGDLIRLDPF